MVTKLNVKMSVPSQPVEGFFFDELSKIRVVEPETAGNTEELKEECREFVNSKQTHILVIVLKLSFVHFLEISEFQALVGGFIEMVDSLAKQVEDEKTKVSQSVCVLHDEGMDG